MNRLFLPTVLLVPLALVSCGETPAQPAPHTEEPPNRGTLVFAAPADHGLEIFTVSGAGGEPTRLTVSPGQDDSPAWSPDGSLIAFSSERAGTADIWVMDADGGNPRPITSGPERDSGPAWSPDGKRIVFDRRPVDRAPDLWTVRADGSSEERLTSGDAFEYVADWSPLGDRIAFTRGGAIWSLDLATGAEAELTAGVASAYAPRWHPDGSRLAFIMTTRSFWKVYEVPAGGGAAEPLMTPPWNTVLVTWAPDGEALAVIRWAGGVYGDLYVDSLDGGMPSALTDGAEVEGILSARIDWREY